MFKNLFKKNKHDSKKILEELNNNTTNFIDRTNDMIKNKDKYYE